MSSSSITQSSAPASHSAQVDIELWVNGSVFPVAQLGPDFLILVESAQHPPTDARIVLRVDASRREWPVHLPQGIQSDSPEVPLAPAA